MLPGLSNSGLAVPQPPSGSFVTKRPACSRPFASYAAPLHVLRTVCSSALPQASTAGLVAADLPTQERWQPLGNGANDITRNRDAAFRQEGFDRDHSRDATQLDGGDDAPNAVQPSVSLEPPPARAVEPDMLLLPVAVCKTVTLPLQATIADGAAELLRRLPAAATAHEAFPSGVVRLEVAVPRTATTALRWLSGQQQSLQQSSRSSDPMQQRRSPAAAGPFMYFSGRRSSAPDTLGATAAEAATRGWSALAGAGAAWRWWGPGGEGFDSRVVSALQRFLSPNQPRLRILGGVRFDPRRVPDPEWAPFGSHCFVLPLLELTEAEDCCLLAVTLAWDPAAAEAAKDAQHGFCGCSSLEEAAGRAEAALLQMRPPAPTSAYGFRVSRSEPHHAPSKSEWDAHMATLLGGLQEGHDTGAPAAAALASLLDPGLARQEYLTHGQQGLDDLLAAMTLSASTSNVVRQSADGDGLDALRDLIDGKVTVSDLTAAARAGAGAASVTPPGAAGPEVRPMRAQAAAEAAGAAAGSLAGAVAAAAATAAVAEAAEAEADEELSKVVMARRTTMRIEGPLDPLHVLTSLQERDPRAYQLYFAPGVLDTETALPPAATGSRGHVSPGRGTGTAGTGPGPAFLACTPERLYARTGRFVASEAVAGTRPRGKGGDVEQDFWLSLDLLRSAKDHAEFSTVRDWIASQLAGPCEDVTVEIRKSVLKQGSVQHLFGRVAARLRRGRNDAHLLAALHPTPAVCGRPREAALGYLEELEAFDRGWYAGPFGWISGAGAEFVVAIRSGLVCPEHSGRAGAAANGAAADPEPAGATASSVMHLPHPQPQPQAQPQAQRSSSVWSPYGPTSLVHMFAGVGVVRGSDPAAEWQELDLKIRPLSSALLPAPLASAAPNINVAWASLMVEELCRLGVNMFCVAPGSRSSPLTHAIASHPRARLNVCIDERSLGFWALGYGRAAGRPAAVVTSSGTAVANLLPAVVEASLSGVPLMLLTADRPGELRDTAANQTIDQTKIFGGFVRWFFDLPPPAADVPGRTILTTASTAYRAAVSTAPPGPVHLNLQFREPLAPVAVPWQSGPFMQGLAQWQASQLPYTSHISGAALPGMLPPGHPSPGAGGLERYGTGGADVAALQSLLAGARRGLVVVGELTDPRDILAARQICSTLGWPVVADVLSGLRVGAPAASPSGRTPALPAVTSPPTAAAAMAATGLPYDSSVPLVHHMDHLLLGDRSWWRELRPDVILQLGPHLTSKRLGQFMDWAAWEDGISSSPSASSTSTSGSAGSSAGGVPWVYVAPHTLRHDPSHLVSHRAVMQLTDFRDAVVAPAAAAAAAAAAAEASGRGGGVAADPWAHVSEYGRMLLQLEEAVSHEIDAALASLDSVSEPFIARSLARSLPPGHGLFIGNSMPIRDMDMYACPLAPVVAAAAPSATAAAPAADSAPATAAVPVQAPVRSGGAVCGVPVAANRGASGIDGVLSTAAGFAEGLSRPVTLLVGDLSFLHDINGLNLLRAGELRPPLTVVLINNSGGGIFSFLPIAASVPEDEFTPLWATPQNVDLEAMCRAQGIPHQKVTETGGLLPALQAAWGLNRHSVVEVITDRTTNVELHRVVQAAALRAAKHAHTLARLSVAAAAAATARAAAAGGFQPLLPETSAAAATTGPVSLTVTNVSWHRYRLPLAQPLTTTATAATAPADTAATAPTGVLGAAVAVLGADGGSGGTTSGGSAGTTSGLGWREGLLVRVRLAWPDGRLASEGLGEVAPLPGLHVESLEEAEVQVAALSGLLEGVPLPPSLALLGGRVTSWLRQVVGLSDPRWLVPSVSFGLECALLSALAAALGTTVTDLLAPSTAPPPSPTSTVTATSAAPPTPTPTPASSDGSRSVPLDSAKTGRINQRLVLVNGLLSPPVTADEAADAAAAAAAAARLVTAGYTAIKVKVARRPDPEADARILAAVRAAVGPHVVLRADANRGWGGLEAAVVFGRAVSAAGLGLQYVEEPTADPRDMATFYTQTGVPVAADESLDEGLLTTGPQPPHLRKASTSLGASFSAGSGNGNSGGVGGAGGASYSAYGLPADRAAGLAAVVVKPAVVGGLEAAAEWALWGRRHGVQVVISSAFESSVGLAHLVQLAAATDALYGNVGDADHDVAVHHGLGTLQWFAADVSTESLSLEPALLPPSSNPQQQQHQQPHKPQVPTRSSGAVAAGRHLPGSGEFVPLQALCARLDQADRLLKACARGDGLRPEALSATPAHGSRDVQHTRVTEGANGSAHNGTESPHAGDPWDFTTAHGDILHRSLSLEVSIPVPPAVSALASEAGAAATAPLRLPTDDDDDGGGDSGRLHVRVHGLEVLPAAGAVPDGSGASPPRPFLFLHGFLGSGADWRPLMQALAAAGHRCVALDLPGHGGTVSVAAAPPPPFAAAVANGHSRDHARAEEHRQHVGQGQGEGQGQQRQDSAALPVTPAHTIPGAAACVVAAARQLGLEGAVLVGYSLGARVALQAAVDLEGCHGPPLGTADGDGGSGSLLSGVVLISGTAGIKDTAQAAARAANDDRLAASLVREGLAEFVRRWYEQPLWSPLRRHPAFGRMLARRTAAAPSDVAADESDGEGGAATVHSGEGAAVQMAAALSGMSTGRMVPLWDRLDPWVGPPVVLVVGDLDAKFVDINTHMLARLVRHRTAVACSTLGAHQQNDAARAANAAVTSLLMTTTPMTDGLGAGVYGNNANQQLQQEQQQQLQPQQERGRGGLVLSEQVQQLGHALVRIEGVGHAVHVESPERLLGVLQEAVSAFDRILAFAP